MSKNNIYQHRVELDNMYRTLEQGADQETIRDQFLKIEKAVAGDMRYILIYGYIYGKKLDKHSEDIVEGLDKSSYRADPIDNTIKRNTYRNLFDAERIRQDSLIEFCLKYINKWEALYNMDWDAKPQKKRRGNKLGKKFLD